MKLGISHIWDHNAMYEKTLSYNVKTKSREGWGFKKKTKHVFVNSLKMSCMCPMYFHYTSFL